MACRCLVKKKKAMKINMGRNGDDFFLNRLFSYVTSELDDEIQGVKKLRGDVYLIHTEQAQFILKGYKDLRKMKMQEAFTSSLRKAGFDHTYRFYRQNQAPLHFEGLYYGCIEYIEPNENAFHYGRHGDRADGVELLHSYHEKTTELIPLYAPMLPKADLAGKWQLRMNEFSTNQPAVNYYVNNVLTNELLEWADFSLDGFFRSKKNLEKEQPVILHGDVAHHNFLRSQSGQLYLIDFDLISSGSKAYDMLQYANRILPFLDWKYESLAKMKYLNHWLKEDAFLYGLLYPADVLREWNRLLRERSQSNPYRLAPIIEMTVNQFQQRKKFLEEVKSRLSS